MKNLIVIAFTFVFLMSLTGCDTLETDDLDNLSTQNAYFVGKVIERYREGYLLKVTNTGNHYFAIDDWVAVDIDNENWLDFSVGDYLWVQFDDSRPTGDPPLIESKYVYSIIKTDENGNRIE